VTSLKCVPACSVMALAAALIIGHGTVTLSGQTSAYGVTIPAAHPRLWWTPARIAQAQTWHQAHPYTPPSGDPLGQAYRCVVTGEAGYCQAAVTYALNQLCGNAACNSPDPNVGVAADDARWEGENVILVLDWCYQYFTPAQRMTIINRWNTYFHNIRQHTWGGPAQHQSNYNWGYMRNEIEWGIATWGENPQADVNLQHGLMTRWQANLLPHFLGAGRGGVMQEGSAYGSALGQYAAVPFGSAALLGRDVYRETNFFREAVFYLVYATLPAPTFNVNNGGSFPEMFPFADDERFFDGGMPARVNYGSFMQAMADYWRDVPVGAYARQWLNTVDPVRPPHIAAVDRGGSAAAFSSLPLDYYASGPRFLYARDQWGPQATVLALQLGVTDDDGHRHNDVGSWQLWRHGRWVSRETTGYAQDIVGFGGVMVDANNAAAHNSLLVSGKGPAAGYQVGQTVVRRLESRPGYTFASVDLTPSYRATHPVLDNPAVAHVERDVIFVRALETLVLFDRVEATTAAPGKVFLAHFETSPVVDAAARTVTAVNGTQVLRLTTLVPAAPIYRPVVNEGGQVGQFRVEIETAGTPLSHFLNVLQAKGAADAVVTASVVDNGASYTVTLAHPTRGTTLLVLEKGRVSAGGSITTAGQAAALATTVQSVTVTDAGVTWGAAAPVSTQPPAAPSGLRVTPP
jgi:hypothetical protein